MALNNGSRAKLKKLIPLLGSDQPGERDSTVLAIGRVLQANGTDFHSLASTLTKAPKASLNTMSNDPMIIAPQLERALLYINKLNNENAKLKAAIKELTEGKENRTTWWVEAVVERLSTFILIAVGIIIWWSLKNH